MSVQANINKVTDLADEVVRACGLSLVEVRFGQQGRNRTLEVTIYKPGARIGLDECEQVSRKLEALLDEQVPPVIDGTFLLEVQSPGTDRKLSSEREFALFSGQNVEVKTKQKTDGLGSAFKGKLVGLKNDAVTIANPIKMSDSPQQKKGKPKPEAETMDEVTVEMNNIISVKLIPVPQAESTIEYSGE